ncbi:MAG: DUF2254 domain-containing protein [Sphingomonadaceae bacterium]|nr:DUF2254 domain-containing protein [Sphingomonadaceae bacterium]
MIARLRSLWLSVNASYWFYPALFSVNAFFLSFITIWLDRNGAAEWLGQFSWIQPSRPEGARTVLTVIAGSMIGVASTVFSITIAAVAYASGNYGPRLLTNFMEDKGNQLSLGVFIATFVYAVMVLRVVRGEDERAASAADAAATTLPGFTPQLSLLVATAMAIWAVAVLVYFLHHIPASIRINTVLKGIGARFVAHVRWRYTEEHEERDPPQQIEGETVTATANGYVKIIDFATLDNLAEEHGAQIALQLRTGDFVHSNVPLVEIKGCELTDELAAEIRECFATGAMRTATQDLEYLIDELVEIALRALSPGINDPFTAITSLHWLGAGTAELARRDLDRGPEQDSYDRERVQPLDDDFEHFLRRGFGAIRASAATSAMTSKKFLDALLSVARACRSHKRRNVLLAEGLQLLEQAKLELKGPSLEELQVQFDEFAAAMEALGV